MRTVGADEAQSQLAELLDNVAAGETITIARNGVPVARLVPPIPEAPGSRRETIAALLDFGKGRTLGGIAIRDLIDDGRRF
jgi:prevent-host-death family protein